MNDELDLDTDDKDEDENNDDDENSDRRSMRSMSFSANDSGDICFTGMLRFGYMMF